MSLDGGSIQSMATLSNIGNSCYLNSVVYTLRFTPNFLHSLHHLVDDLQQQQVGLRRAKTSSLGRHQTGHGPTANGARSLSSKDLLATTTTTTNGGGLGPGTAALLNGGAEPTRAQLKCQRQTATEKLHELYQSLARNENVHHLEPFQPVQLLNAIQDVSTTFEGNQQQDAHEFLMCILDSIRETCTLAKERFAESTEFRRTLNG